MRKPSRPPTPPSAKERDSLARSYSHVLDGTVVSLTRAALKQVVTHRRDAVSASRRERRRMAAILRDDKVQAIVNKAIQRQLDKQEKRAPPPRILVRVAADNRRKFERKPHKIRSKSYLPLPRYDGPIIDRQGRRGIVMTIAYDGAKKHTFGIVGRRIVYISDPEHCECDPLGRSIFFSNMGGDLDEILMGADLLELTQRESRADAKINVNIIIQLPHDVPQEVRAAILKAVAHELFGRHGLPYAAALHRPDPDGDQRNYHGHITGSWRPMTRVAPYDWDIAQDYRADLDGAAYWRHARRRVAEIMTATVERAGTERHYTHLSNAERGLVHKPQKKLDKRKTRAAREGEFVADNEANRERMAANVALETKLEAKRLARRERALKRRLAVLAPVKLASLRPVDLQPVAPVQPIVDIATIGPVKQPPIVTESPVRAVQIPRIRFGAVGAVSVDNPKLLEGAARVRTVTPPRGIGPGATAVRSVRIGPQRVRKNGIQAVAVAKSLRQTGAIKPVEAALPPHAAPLRQVTPAATIEAQAKTGALAPVWSDARDPAELRPVERAQITRVPLGPVAAATNDAGWPRTIAATTPSRAARPIEQTSMRSGHSPVAKTLDTASAPAMRPSAVAKVTTRIDAAWPRLHPVLPVPSAPLCVSQAAGPKPVARHNLRGEVESLLLPVATAAPSGSQTGLRSAESSNRASDPVIRPVPPKPVPSPLKPVPTMNQGAGAGSTITIRPVAPIVPPRLDPALAETMRTFGERLAAMAASRSSQREKGAPERQRPGENSAVAAHGAHGSATDPSNAYRREVQDARAFIARVKSKAIHIGVDEDGLILPQPIYWAGNRLTRRGLSDPKVQAELIRMEQRQADYMRHIHPILRETVTAQLLAKGSPAIIEKLPEEERARAEAWAKTGVWPSLMRMVVEEGERCSRRDLKHWRKAREKTDGSHLASAAKAQAQWNKWPVDLAPEDRQALNRDAQRHRANLAAQQALARQNGIV